MTLNILWFKVGPKPDVFGGGNDMVSQMKLITFKYLLEIIWGCVKPRALSNGFSRRYRFFLLSFFQVLASHLDQRIHMSEERKKEKE